MSEPTNEQRARALWVKLLENFGPEQLMGDEEPDPRTLEAALDAAEQRAYLEGVKCGLAAFAWWKDGTQYVGTCGTTLKQALELADKGELYGQCQDRGKEE